MPPKNLMKQFEAVRNIIPSGVSGTGCTIVIDNRTDYDLTDANSYVACGKLNSPPTTIEKNGHGEFIAQESSLTGSSGLVSWNVSGVNKRVIAVWNTPKLFYPNSMVVAIADTGKYDKSWYDMINNNKTGNGMTMVKANYSQEVNEISVVDGPIKFTGTMGTSHNPVVKIFVSENDKK